MSQWTHVAGCIRVDGIHGIVKYNRGTIGKLLGTNTPCGSEGSLKYIIQENPDKSSVCMFVVLIWGDLRDYDDSEEIINWIKKIIKGKIIRDLVVSIDVEYKKKIVLSIGDKKPILKIIKSEI